MEETQDRKLVVGTTWQHYKGNTYLIVALALNEADKIPVVVYQSEKDHREVWVRSREDFLATLTSKEGEFYRFTKLTPRYSRR
jgi:hypothetical protein